MTTDIFHILHVNIASCGPSDIGLTNSLTPRQNVHWKCKTYWNKLILCFLTVIQWSLYSISNYIVISSQGLTEDESVLGQVITLWWLGDKALLELILNKFYPTIHYMKNTQFSLNHKQLEMNINTIAQYQHCWIILSVVMGQFHAKILHTLRTTLEIINQS